MPSVQQQLIELYSSIDHAFDEVRHKYPDQVQCGRGCDDCCRAVFDISLVEAVALASVFQGLPEDTGKQVLQRAAAAISEWVEIRKDDKGGLARERIRCPLLDDDGLCLCYEARPVNCRTYGIPTVINGAGHVCGFSGFEKGMDYPVVNLERVQGALLEMSILLAGESSGKRRWPVAKVLLDPQGIFKLL